MSGDEYLIIDECDLIFSEPLSRVNTIIQTRSFKLNGTWGDDFFADPTLFASMAEPRNSVEMTQPRSSPARNGNNGAIATEPSGYSRQQFRTDYCHCCNDEHTCWWGFWYCWLLQARTARIFELDASINQITIYLLFFIGSYFLGFYFIIVGFLVLAVNRAFLRTSLRRKLNIHGTLCGDCVLHCCCSSCAICQEAREARILHSDTMDLVSGEELATQEEFYKRATGHGERGTADQPKEVR